MGEVRLYRDDDPLFEVDPERGVAPYSSAPVGDHPASGIVGLDRPVEAPVLDLAVPDPAGGQDFRERFGRQETGSQVSGSEPHQVLRRRQEPAARPLVAVVHIRRVQQFSEAGAVPPGRLSQVIVGAPVRPLVEAGPVRNDPVRVVPDRREHAERGEHVVLQDRQEILAGRALHGRTQKVRAVRGVGLRRARLEE